MTMIEEVLKNVNLTRGLVLVKKIIAKCPKCGMEKMVSRMLGSESAEGDCDYCKIHFVTAIYWRPS